MKRLLWTLTTTLMTLAPALSQATVPAISCENLMYRESSMSLHPDGEMRIQDTAVARPTALLAHLAKKHNLGTLTLQKAAVSVKAKNVTCQTLGRYPTKCQTATGSEGRLDLDMWVNGPNLQGNLRLSIPVIVSNFDLQANLSSPAGPIQLGPDPVTVRLNTLRVTAQSSVDFEGIKVDLDFGTFFYTDRGSNSNVGLSYCN